MPRLTEEEIDRALSGADLAGWRRNDREIFKHFRFDSFRQAISFIDRIADRAEAANHHPDLENHYDRVRVGLHTWSENAITGKDLALARAIESVAAGTAEEGVR